MCTRGVRVSTLAPDYFPTELTGHLADVGFAQSVRERTLLARTPALEEVDGPFLFQATAASGYMTGQVLVIDGGWIAVWPRQSAHLAPRQDTGNFPSGTPHNGEPNWLPTAAVAQYLVIWPIEPRLPSSDYPVESPDHQTGP